MITVSSQLYLEVVFYDVYPKICISNLRGRKIVCVTRSQQGEISHLYQRFDSRCKLHFIVKKLGYYQSKEGEYRYIPANVLDVVA